MNRPCLEPRCPNLATYRGRCPDHQRRRNRETSPNASLYSTKRWKITRRKKLNANPICERCDIELAGVVHHKQDLQDGGEPFAWENLEALCVTCHNRETRARQVVA